jgi:bifunctional DNA-binding transcriptional regulator/antitoxin component of YhaV-PrlF toxin-antitoxin module
MNIQRGRLVSGGRLQVPAEMRRVLGLSDGDPVIMEVVNGELHVRPLREAIARVRELLRPYRPKTGSVVDEFIAERRAEAAKE